MMFDSDVLIWATRGNVRAADAIDSATLRSLSMISLIELLQGARSRLECRNIRRELHRLAFTVLPLSESIGAVASALVEQFAFSQGVRVADALIAATALDAGEVLCTTNSKHFRSIRGLSILPFTV